MPSSPFRRLLLSRLPAIAVLIVSLSVTVIGWRYVENNLRRESETIFLNEIEKAVDVLHARTEIWMNVINGAHGLFAASVHVDRDEWRAYIAGISEPILHPSLIGIGYLARVPTKDLPAHEKLVRSGGLPNYSVRLGNDTRAEDHFPLIYFEPSSNIDPKIFGHDFSLDQAHLFALDAARRTGLHFHRSTFPFISEPVFLIYRAFQRNGNQEGIIVGVFDGKRIFDRLIEQQYFQHIGYDIVIDSRAAIATPPPPDHDRSHTAIREFMINDSHWTIRFFTYPSFFTSEQRWLSRGVGAAGLVISILLFTTTWILGTSRDRAARLAAKMTEDFSRSEERFRTLIENVPGAIYRCANDPSWTMEFLSDDILEITGYPASDFIGNSVRSYASVIHPEDIAMVNRIVQDGVRENRPYIIEYRIIDATGAVKWVYEKGRGILDSAGNLLHLDGAIFDVTARKALEEQLYQAQKMESIGQLAGGVAHDFNNIMMVIDFHSQRLIQAIPDTHPAAKSIEVLQRSARRATSLTQQLLAFGRRQVLDLCSMTLNTFITENIPLVEPVLGTKINLQTHLTEEPTLIKGDHGLLSQALINLVVNARDAMPDGGTVTIRTTQILSKGELSHIEDRIPPGKFVVLSVKDTGTGIPPDELSRIFEPFFTTKPLGRGTGLGLAMVYGIVRQHEGFIACESTPGVGSTFSLYFPLAPEEAAGSGGPGETVKAKPVILVVDDDEEILTIAAEMLRDAEYTVLTAKNGRRAIEEHEAAATIDLLFTDIVMPMMSGDELSARIQRQRPKMKVLYTSGYADDFIVRHGISRTSGIFIPKPYSSSELLRKVREILKN